MIVVSTYTSASDAFRAKTLLETNGISCQLKHDQKRDTQSIGVIELLVDAPHAKVARDVLANAIGSDNT